MPLVFRQPGLPLHFKFEVLGEVQANFAILKIVRKVRDLSPVWGDVEDIIIRDIETVFELEGRPPWPPLSPFTLRQRERLGYPYPIYPMLVMTGRLKRSLIDKTHPEHISEKRPKFLEFGTRVPYAIYHQSPQPRRRLPRRPFIFIDKKVINSIVQTIRKYLIGTGEAIR